MREIADRFRGEQPPEVQAVLLDFAFWSAEQLAETWPCPASMLDFLRRRGDVPIEEFLVAAEDMTYALPEPSMDPDLFDVCYAAFSTLSRSWEAARMIVTLRDDHWFKLRNRLAAIELAPGVKQASLFTGDMP